jgi:hypothetical protein
MLPAKIAELLSNMRAKTEAGELIWNYDDNNTQVSIDLANFHISLEYSFNTIEEVGQFKVVYFDKSTNREHYFSTNQLYNDYEVARRLFDSAQSSGLNIKF